jgi:hypothetical protein
LVDLPFQICQNALLKNLEHLAFPDNLVNSNFCGEQHLMKVQPTHQSGVEILEANRSSQG